MEKWVQFFPQYDWCYGDILLENPWSPVLLRRNRFFELNAKAATDVFLKVVHIAPCYWIINFTLGSSNYYMTSWCTLCTTQFDITYIRSQNSNYFLSLSILQIHRRSLLVLCTILQYLYEIFCNFFRKIFLDLYSHTNLHF